MASVSLHNLTKRFGRTTALRGLNLEVRDREFFVLLGPTGAGKTTTLRLIAGLDAPNEGSISIDGKDVSQWSAAERDVALVFQYYSLYPHYTVRENLEFPLKSRIRNTTPEEMRSRVEKVASTLRITHLLDRKTDRLSGGEMQRVSIGRAIVRDPKLFLMDEPLSNLDAKLREILRAELKGLQMNLGDTFVYVTHDQVEAMTMGDRIGILHEGQLVQVGTPYDIYNQPQDTFVASFVGSPTMNMMPVVVRDNRIVVVSGQVELPVEGPASERLNGASGELTFGIRSEDIQLDPGSPMQAQVYGVENYGVEKVVTVKIGEALLRASMPTKVDVRIDSRIPIAFNPAGMHFFGRSSGVNTRT